jgi:hypothetical protein
MVALPRKNLRLSANFDRFVSRVAMVALPCVRVHRATTRRVSENGHSRLLECGRLRDFEASGCIRLRIAQGGRYQAVCQACCEGRLQWSTSVVGGCNLTFDYGLVLHPLWLQWSTSVVGGCNRNVGFSRRRES